MRYFYKITVKMFLKNMKTVSYSCTYCTSILDMYGEEMRKKSLTSTNNVNGHSFVMKGR
jgi:hypothetical protein